MQGLGSVEGRREAYFSGLFGVDLCIAGSRLVEGMKSEEIGESRRTYAFEGGFGR